MISCVIADSGLNTLYIPYSLKCKWKRCFVYFPVLEGDPLVKKTACQNNTILVKIGYVLLLQQYNRLPLVVKSHPPHTVHRL